MLSSNKIQINCIDDSILKRENNKSPLIYHPKTTSTNNRNKNSFSQLSPPKTNAGSSSSRPSFFASPMNNNNNTNSEANSLLFPLKKLLIPLTPLKTANEDMILTRRALDNLSKFSSKEKLFYEKKMHLVNRAESRLSGSLIDKTDFIDNIDNQDSVNRSFAMFRSEITLFPDKFTHFILEAHSFVYFKIECMNHRSPLKIMIQNVDKESGNAKIKVYVSKFNHRPSCLNCDYALESRCIKILEKSIKGIFQIPFYYFAIYSESRLNAKIRYFFADKQEEDIPDEKPKIFVKTPVISATAKKIDEVLGSNAVQILEEIREVRKRRKERLLTLSRGVDKVKHNKEMAASLTMRQSFLGKQDRRSESVLEKKRAIDLTNYQKKVFLSQKHEILKRVTQAKLQKHMEEQTITFKNTTWLTCIVAMLAYKKFYERFHNTQQIARKKHRTAIKFSIFMTRIQKNLRKFGLKFQTRLFSSMHFGLYSQAILSASSNYKKGQKFITNFLKEETKELYKLKNAFFRRYDQYQLLKDRWLKYKGKKILLQKIIFEIWDKYQLNTIMDQAKFKAGKKLLFLNEWWLHIKSEYHINFKKYRELCHKYSKAFGYLKFLYMAKTPTKVHPLIAKLENSDPKAQIYPEEVDLFDDEIYKLQTEKTYPNINAVPPKLFILPTVTEAKELAFKLANKLNNQNTTI